MRNKECQLVRAAAETKCPRAVVRFIVYVVDDASVPASLLLLLLLPQGAVGLTWHESDSGTL